MSSPTDEEHQEGQQQEAAVDPNAPWAYVKFETSIVRIVLC